MLSRQVVVVVGLVSAVVLCKLLCRRIGKAVCAQPRASVVIDMKTLQNDCCSKFSCRDSRDVRDLLNCCSRVQFPKVRTERGAQPLFPTLMSIHAGRLN